MERENRAALQAHLVALADCRFLADEPEFVRFFRDMAADTTPLMVNRSLVKGGQKKKEGDHMGVGFLIFMC